MSKRYMYSMKNSSSINFSKLSHELDSSYTMDMNSSNEYLDYTFNFNGRFPIEDLDSLRKPWILQPNFIPTVAVYGVAFLVGVIGNLLVIFAVLCDKKSRSVTSNFMVSLAVADILFLVICVPYNTSEYVVDYWTGGLFLCKFAGFIEMLSAVASILNLSSVSVERFIVIVLPMKSRRWCTAGNTKKIILCVWFVSVVLSSPTLYVMNIEIMTYYNNVSSITKSVCATTGVENSGRLAFAIYRQLIMFSIPSLIMVVCYSAVIYALWISSRQLSKLTGSSSCSSTISIERIHMRPPNQTYTRPSPAQQYNRSPCQTYNIVPGSPYTNTTGRCRKYNIRNGVKDHSVEILKARRQVIKMLIAVVAAFLLCWGPKLSFEVVKRLELKALYHHKIFFIIEVIFECLPYVQSALNPIIYGFMSRNFRRSLKAACQRPFCPCKYLFRYHKKKVSFPDIIEMDSKLSNGTVNTRMTRNSGSSEDFQCLSTTGGCATY